MINANADQATYWESAAGQKWIDHEAVLDACLAPVRDRMLDLAELNANARVLDIGCGTGDSTAAAAEGSKEALGLDISELMIARARARFAAPTTRFEVGDAQTRRFSAEFTHIVSRFGLMFFSDPVAAFANLTKAVPPAHKLTFAAWGPAENTAWFSIPKKAAEARLGPGPTRDPFAPGPLAFKDLDRVLDIMTAAGWRNAQGVTENLVLTPGFDISLIAPVAATVGPAARIISHHDADAATARAITDDIARAMVPYVTDDGLALPAAINFFAATAPD